MSAEEGAESRNGSGQVDDIADGIWRWAKQKAIGRMDLSFGAKECWRILAGFPEGSCFPSHYHIAETMGKSKSAVRRYLRELAGRNYIEITAVYDTEPRNGPRRRGQRRPRGQTSNTYTIRDQPDLIACATQIAQEWRAKQQTSKG
jgi:hypothetical protein